MSAYLTDAQAREYVTRIANLCRRVVSTSDEFDAEPSVVGEELDLLDALITEYFKALAGELPGQEPAWQRTTVESEPFCHAGRDGACVWRACPQAVEWRRQCPLDRDERESLGTPGERRHCSMGDHLQQPLMVAREIRQWLTSALRERTELVAFLSRLYPSHLARHPKEDRDCDNEWRTIVCIHIPMELDTQYDAVRTMIHPYTWHVHDVDVGLFPHLEWREDDWDGSTTEEKYRRLRRLP